MGNRLLRIVIIACLLWICGNHYSVLADEISDKQTQLEQVQIQMNAEEQRRAKAAAEVDTISGKLQVVQQQLEIAESKLKEVNENIATVESNIAANIELLDKTENSLQIRKKIFYKRMRDIFIDGQVSYVDVLFGAKDINDLVMRFDILKKVLQRDKELIEGIRREQSLIKQKRAEMESDRANLQTLQVAAAKEKAILDDKKAEHAELLHRANNDLVAAEQAYQELQNQSRQIEIMIRRIQGGSHYPSGGTGQFVWPVYAEITSDFGWRVHPIFGTEKYHSGIDLGASYGETIVAADGGVVVYSDWMSGYGKTIIIDHGNGLSTLYGHCSELYVSDGQTVGKGQPIAAVGSTGYSTGPHLHFEVRSDGSPVNPMSYLP